MSQDHFLNLQPGTIINGRYEIVKCLGTGSMGMVYACRHRELAGHLVAMKVLFAEVARDNVAAARFRNEIVASYGVSHPNVVRAYEYFRDGDLVAFTMEYIGGGDLADRINSDEALSIEEIVRMVSQMCSGVQAIHDAGIIHRDLKPENILLTVQGDIKITDFGIARMGGTGPKLTEHGGVVGTIDYVSPEYLEKGQVDARSDIYALGVLAYEMITGESPFRGQSVIETMTMRLRSDPEAPTKLRLDCPGSLSNIVLKAMARDPDKRYQTAAEMLYDLTALSNSSVPSYFLTQSKGAGSKVDLPAFSNGQLSSSGTQNRPNPSAQNSVAPNSRMQQTSEQKTSPSGTVIIDSNSVRGGSRDSKPVSKIENLRDQHGGSGSSGSRSTTSAESVRISSGKLSPERVQALFQDFQPVENESFFKTILGWLFVLFIGFGVGICLLRVTNPERFGVIRDAVPTYLDPSK